VHLGRREAGALLAAASGPLAVGPAPRPGLRVGPQRRGEPADGRVVDVVVLGAIGREFAARTLAEGGLSVIGGEGRLGGGACLSWG
jgi:hypothetical protein